MKAVIDFVKNALRYIGKMFGFIAVPAAEHNNMISPENSTEKIHSGSLQALNIKNTKKGSIAKQCPPEDSDKLAAEISSLRIASVSATTISTTAEVTNYKNRAIPVDCCLGTDECSSSNDHLHSVNSSSTVTRSRSDPTTIKYTTENDSMILSVKNTKSVSHDGPLANNSYNLSMYNWRKGEKECIKGEKNVIGRIRQKRTRKLKRQRQREKDFRSELSLIANSAEQNSRKNTEATNSDEKLINKNVKKEVIRNIKCTEHIENATVKEAPRNTVMNESKLSRRNKVIFSMQSLQWPFV